MSGQGYHVHVHIIIMFITSVVQIANAFHWGSLHMDSESNMFCLMWGVDLGPKGSPRDKHGLPYCWHGGLCPRRQRMVSLSGYHQRSGVVNCLASHQTDMAKLESNPKSTPFETLWLALTKLLALSDHHVFYQYQRE